MKVSLLISTVGVAALAACSDGTVDPLTGITLLDRDVALLAADGIARDVEVMRGPGGPFGLGLPADPGRFECGAVEHNGVTVNRTCVFLDAGGAEQASYDPDATASVIVHAEVSGTPEHGPRGGAAAIDRTSDMTASGLAGAETSVVWNGTGHGTMSHSRVTPEGDAVSFDMSSTQSVSEMEIPVPRTEDGWPLGGTVTMSVTVSVSGGPGDGTTHQRDVMIVFDGTQFAAVTVNGEVMTVDLAERRNVLPPHRGRGPGRHR
ncbi:MAG TPA: hypothetical protein VGA37_07300 [Gemmatimonadales bacterium]